MMNAQELTADWTFMFTDIEDSTKRGTKAHPAEYRRVVEEHKARLRVCFEAHHGTVDRQPGDGFLVTFRTPSQAIACAVAIQEDLREDGNAAIQTESDGKAWVVQVRIGVYKAAGEVSRNPDGTVTDTEVNLASRFASCAVGGQIVVNPAAYQAIKRHQLPYKWKEWPNRYIRDFEGPQLLHELLWDETVRVIKAPLWAPAWLLRETNAFVGRREILETIQTWLDGDRPLLVLHGEGGVGKTRLMSQAVRAFGAVFEGHIYGVALDREFSAPPGTITAMQVAARIGEALDAPPDVLNSESLDALVKYMARQFGTTPCWLILDNFESVQNLHTLELLGTLVYSVPGLRCAVTSRELVDLVADTVAVQVPGMAVPSSAETSLQTLETYESYTLFRTRAEQYDPKPDLSDTAALGRILRATEGNSLALELIAAHCKNPRLTLQAIAEGLEASRLKWLRPTSGSLRYGPTRHKNLEACIDWSYQRLSADEQTLYPRLSVFPADFEVEAAEAIADIPTDLLDHWILFHLVQVEATSKRCFLQPVLHEFATARLTPESRKADRLRFAVYYGDLADANQNLNQATQRAILRTELRNLHEAADYLCAPTMQTETTAPYLNNLGNRLCQVPIGTRSENLQRAIACYQAAMRVRTQADFPQDWAATQNNLGNAYSDLPTGDRGANLLQAIECYQAALRVRTQADFPQDWAMTQNNLGSVYRNLPTGDRGANLLQAIECYQAALRVYTQADFPMNYGHSHVCLGNAYAGLSEPERAREHFGLAVQGYAAAGLPSEWEWRAYTERRLRELGG